MEPEPDKIDGMKARKITKIEDYYWDMPGKGKVIINDHENTVLKMFSPTNVLYLFHKITTDVQKILNFGCNLRNK